MALEGAAPVSAPEKRAEALIAGAYAIAIHPAVGFLAAGAAVEKAYADLREHGTSTDAVDLYDFGRFNELVGFPDVWDFERRHPEPE